MTVKLYTHCGHMLLPLLRAHLPYSLSIYGTLLATQTARISSEQPPLRKGANIVPTTAAERGEGEVHGHQIWTTFRHSERSASFSPPRPRAERDGHGAVGGDDGDAFMDGGIWTAIIAYPSPDRQIRIYNSLEHPHHRSRLSSSALPGRLDAARVQIVQAIEAYIQHVDPGMTYIGKVHELWLDAVEGYIAGRAAGLSPPVSDTIPFSSALKDAEGVKQRAASEDPLSKPIDLNEADTLLKFNWKKQGRYWVWCPPWGTDEGYAVDIGRPEDIADFEGPGPSNRVPGYYAARIPYSTVIRPIRADTIALSQISGSFDELWTPSSARSHADPSSSASSSDPSTSAFSPKEAAQSATPAARILTHPDGGIGALSTAPPHRRRRLARWVVEAHLASGRGRIPDPSLNQAAEGAGEHGRAGADDSRAVEWTYAVVHENNEASSALWKSMGWGRVFRCASVYRTEADIAASSGRISLA